MRGLWADFRHALCMGLMAPLIMVPALLRMVGEVRGEPPEFAAPESSWDSNREVPLTDGSVQAMDDYLACVLLGEIPADFSLEALKAQAVAARTYTQLAMARGSKHGGKLCKDSACCQAYRTAEGYLERGGTRENLERIRSAVQQTDGLVLTYEGEYIEATYFSCSGGRTEDAVDVWGVDYPYLRATDSPGEEASLHYREENLFSREALEEALSVTFPSNPENWVGDMVCTEGGGVKTLLLADVCYTGQTLREKLGLPSASFSVRQSGDGLCFETRGYGHRVGLSQYGAEAMAANGATFREILAHYYQNTKLESEPIGESVEN